ncbi:MAG: GGDEF domain-containing protein [bacterium]|nr:GGDEF domain-containing protein [bacterium]
MMEHPAHTPEKERLLLLRGNAELRDRLAERFSDWEFVERSSYLAGIGELCRGRWRAVITGVEPGDPEVLGIEPRIAGLREAAGEDVPIILCCVPETEPLARRGVSCGASEYVMLPLNGPELDAALGYGRVDDLDTEPASPPGTVSMEELLRLGALLEDLAGDGRTFLARLADTIGQALGGAAVRLVVEGSIVETEPFGDPVLVEPIEESGTLLGQISLGPRQGQPYVRAEAEKLRHYGQLAGHLIKAAGAQRQWHRLALTDELSNLPNRRAFGESLKEIMGRAGEERSCATILLFDIDDFKRYNDTCGHDAGDEIIRAVGRLIRQHCRSHDVVARYGGDEFAVVFWDAERPRVPGSRHPDDAVAVLHRFTEALSAHEFATLKHLGPCQLTVSAGLATFPWDGKTAEELITRADQALLRAKRAGKNRVFRIGDGTHMSISDDAG